MNKTSNEKLRELATILSRIRSEIINEQKELKASSAEWIKCEIQIENMQNAIKTLRERIISYGN